MSRKQTNGSQTFATCREAIAAACAARQISVADIKAALGKTGGSFHATFKRGRSFDFVDRVFETLGIRLVVKGDDE